MTRRPGYYLAMFITFAMGGLTLLWRGSAALMPVAPKDRILPPAQEQTAPQPYSTFGGGNVVSPRNGASASFHYINMRDGKIFSEWSEAHKSASDANKVLREVLNQSTKIVERKPVLDREGHEVGVQVIATFSAEYPHFGTASLLWTNKSTFNYVASSSLPDLREYEKDPIHRMRNNRFPTDSLAEAPGAPKKTRTQSVSNASSKTNKR